MLKKWLIALGAIILLASLALPLFDTYGVDKQPEGVYLKCQYLDGKPCNIILFDDGRFAVMSGETFNHPIVDEMFSELQTGELISIMKRGTPVESYPLGVTVIKWRSCGIIDDYKPPEALVQELTEKVQLILIDEG